MKALALAAVGLGVAAGATLHAHAIIREEQVVSVGSARERWRLEWRTRPKSACGPRDEGWSTCPCEGFAFGEMGQLDLVRTRPGHSDETLPLAPLFEDGENPSTERMLHDAVLQRWPVLDSDDEHMDDLSADFERRVHQRSVVRTMKLADYDHDGRATEFMLQVGATPCGHQNAVVVGISRKQPRLHALASVAHPQEPLVLEPHIWEELLHSRGRITSVEWQCGDHGAEKEEEVRLVVSDGGIDATRLTYGCTSGFKRGALKSTEKF